MENVQEIIDIEGVKVPVIRRGDDVYYPVSFVEKHLLLREKGSFLPGVKKEDRVKLTVDYSKWEGGVQEVNCVSEEVLIERLSKTRQRWLSIGQIKSQNRIHRYLGIQELDEEKFEWDSYNIEWCSGYDINLKWLIEEVVEKLSDVKARKCRDCSRVLPLIKGFYYMESRGGIFAHNCTLCKNNGEGTYRVKGVTDKLDMHERYLYDNRQSNLIIEYRKNNILPIYESYLKHDLPSIPAKLKNRNNFYTIMDYLLLNDKLDRGKVRLDGLQKTLRLDLGEFGVTQTEIYQKLFGENFYLEKWRFPNYRFEGDIKLTTELAVTIFDNYLEAHNINIDDEPFTFNYDWVIKQCGISNIFKTLGGICGFFVSYWRGKYAGYQFRRIGNYYTSNEENFLSDLRFLVEKDLKLKPEKIPLYVTKSVLLKQYNSIYNHMKRRDKSIYDYFNILYPDQFIEADFTIGNYRNEFDSIEEQQVDGVLREYFSNVVYNSKGDNRVVLKGKEPDWFIMTEKGVWVVEYFGMYIESQRNNPIISNYIETTHDKIRLYDEMEGYKFVLVYPKDTEKGYLGLRDKLRAIKEKYRVS